MCRSFPLAPRPECSTPARVLRQLRLEGRGARDSGEFLWFWPKSHRAAVILTHDVENNDGIRLALELADVEQEHGFRSSFNFGAWYTAPDAGVSGNSTRAASRSVCTG